MDECTHLGNYSIPVDPGLVEIVTAKETQHYSSWSTKNVFASKIPKLMVINQMNKLFVGVT